MFLLLKNTEQVMTLFTTKVISAMLLLITFFVKLILQFWFFGRHYKIVLFKSVNMSILKNGLFIIDASLVIKYDQIKFCPLFNYSTVKALLLPVEFHMSEKFHMTFIWETTQLNTFVVTLKFQNSFLDQ